MQELLDRLKTTLADCYVIDREIGSGGMAVVYLAARRPSRPVLDALHQAVLLRMFTPAHCV